MVTYILVSVVLILVSLFLINFSKIEKFRTENKRTFDFLMSLISTFIGFFIALSLNTFLGSVQEKNNLVKLLNAGNLAIQNNQMRTQGSYINLVKKGMNVSELIKNTPVELPKIYPNLESNELVNTYFSSNGFQAYILCMDGMENFVKNLNGGNLTDAQKVNALNGYMKYLGLAQKINKLEIDRISGTISQKEEDTQLSSFNNELVAQ